MALVDDDSAEANHAKHNRQAQPVPEVREKELAQILCYFHNYKLIEFLFSAYDAIAFAGDAWISSSF